MVNIPKHVIAKELAFLDGYGTGIRSDSELTVAVWHECLNRELASIHITPAELHQCFYDIAKKATYIPGWEKLTPQVLISAIHTKRAKRIADAPPPTIAPDNPTLYPKWLEARRKALGDGQTPTEAENHAWKHIGHAPPAQGIPTIKIDLKKLLEQSKKERKKQ